MPTIQLLNQATIDKIAAGEVVERPSSVVKELVENAIDAKATAVTVEIKEGGISFIRITDNGCGIEKNQIPLAFLRHSTSKIKCVEDLLSVSSLGFRGEALSSIAAVAQVELITKTYGDLTGTRYVIEGSKEIACEEIGAPEGTTFLVKNLFFNTPARRKFLKTAQTEGGYIADLMERMALSHPNVSFKFINNGQTKLHTSGNGNKKDLIYHVFGRDITSSLIEIKQKTELFEIDGFIGKPNVSRGNRNYENYFINGRYIKSALLSKAIEEGYKGFMMQHQYPFCVLYISMNSELIDVNVHPTKMELRFTQNEVIYKSLYEIIRNALTHKEFIQQVPVKEEKKPETREIVKNAPEPFEVRRLSETRPENVSQTGTRPTNNRIESLSGKSANISASFLNERKINDIRKSVSVDSPYERKYPDMVRERSGFENKNAQSSPETNSANNVSSSSANSVFERLAKRPAEAAIKAQNVEVKVDLFPNAQGKNTVHEIREERTQLPREQEIQTENEIKETEVTGAKEQAQPTESQIPEVYEQQQLDALDTGFLTESARKKHKIIGQLFDTYWLIEYEEKLFIIDQHAAHEKVLYEQTMEKLKDKSFDSQAISPPIILTLDNEEVAMLKKYEKEIANFGYEIEPFGGKEYAITAIPADFSDVDMKSMFIDMLDDFANISGEQAPILIMEKVASMSCKAAVKGHNRLSLEEATHLIDTLLTLENPYQCPHGRPTIISMTKYEIEKKFKRIV
ncbi:MAG: DNA mismatch repair endonuclease MutL [Roseburia sp.]|nr:DNA mismatch repair endonuclease MutL [Roseburia sp.]